MGKSFLDRNLKWIFTLPAVLFIVVAFPIFYTTRLSFFEWSMSGTEAPRWVFLDNYISLFKDNRFTSAIWRTFYFTFFALAIETVLGIAIALLLNRDFPGKNVVKTLFILPMVATPVAMGLVWLLILNRRSGWPIRCSNRSISRRNPGSPRRLINPASPFTCRRIGHRPVV